MWGAPARVCGGSTLGVVRRCPTLPHPVGCSTIGAVGLSFRVRNGTGRFPHAMTAVTLAPQPWGSGKTVVTRCRTVWCSCGVRTVVLELWCSGIQLSVPVPNKPGGGFVGWEPHSGRVQSCFSLYHCLV